MRRDADSFHTLCDEPSRDLCFRLANVAVPKKKLAIQV
jgi:hypothetical protein